MQLSVHPQSSVREGGHCRSCGSSLRSKLRSDRNSDNVLTGRLCYAERHSGCLTCQLMESSQHPKEVGSLTPGFAVRKPSRRALSHSPPPPPPPPAEVPARTRREEGLAEGASWPCLGLPIGAPVWHSRGKPPGDVGRAPLRESRGSRQWLRGIHLGFCFFQAKVTMKTVSARPPTGQGKELPRTARTTSAPNVPEPF